MAEIFDFGLQKYKLQLSGAFNRDSMFAVVGDTARRLEVQLLDSRGVVTDTTGLSLRLSTVTGKQATYTDAVAVDATKGEYRIDLTNGMLLKPGTQEFQWTITDAEGERIHSFPFKAFVGKNLSEGGQQSYNFYLSYDELKDGIKQVEDMQKDLVDGAVDSAAIQEHVADRYAALEEEYAPKLNEVTAQLAHKAGLIEIEKTIRIPRDYPDLQSAIDEVSENFVKHKGKVVLLIETGHALTKGVLIENVNLSNYIIRSEDDVVTLSTDFVGVNIPERLGNYDIEYTNNLFYATNSVFPRLDCIIDMESRFGSGLYLDGNSHCIVTEGSGVRNAGGHGGVARNSRLQANGSEWSGATAYGIRAQMGGIISAQYAKTNDCEIGVFASRGSMIHFAGGEATDCGVAVQAQRSRITAMDANLKRAKNLAAIWAMEGSIISARGADASDSLRRGAHAETSSTIDFTNGKALNTGEQPAYTNTGAMISLTGTEYDVEALNILHPLNGLTAKGVLLDENEPNYITERTLISGGFVTKHPDGTQIVVGTINLGPTTDGNGTFENPYRTPQTISYDFPESFYGQPFVMLQAMRNDTQMGRLINASYSWVSSSQLGGISAWAFTQTDKDVEVRYIAFGRWK